MGQKEKPVTILGRATKIPSSPDEAVLERVPNPHPDAHYVARFTTPEFTCLCPVTGQPDFAHLVIDYVPRDWLVESKSLKLYLNAFRNHGAFHEDTHDRDRQEDYRAAGAPLSAHRRLLVSARRHADRRVLADGHAARGRVAARPWRRALPRTRIAERLARSPARYFNAVCVVAKRLSRSVLKPTEMTSMLRSAVPSNAGPVKSVDVGRRLNGALFSKNT